MRGSGTASSDGSTRWGEQVTGQILSLFMKGVQYTQHGWSISTELREETPVLAIQI